MDTDKKNKMRDTRRQASSVTSPSCHVTGEELGLDGVSPHPSKHHRGSHFRALAVKSVSIRG